MEKDNRRRGYIMGVRRKCETKIKAIKDKRREIEMIKKIMFDEE